MTEPRHDQHQPVTIKPPHRSRPGRLSSHSGLKLLTSYAYGRLICLCRYGITGEYSVERRQVIIKTSETIELKSSAQLEVMREAGRVVANALTAVRRHTTVGTFLPELDELAAAVISEAGAKPSFLHYHPDWAPTPYPSVICTSVNDAVVHGLPNRYQVRDGDLVSIDCGAHVGGLHGDAAISFVVGNAEAADQALIDCTERALHAGIAAARVGSKMGDIAHAIGSVGRSAGYGLLANHGGHGVGRAMHEAPYVPNEGRPRRGMRLRAGLVLALEPMFIAGGQDDYWIDDDGWTLRTIDGSRAAHAEHTIAITDDGPIILTAP